MGEDAILAAPGRAGDFDTIIELRIQHNWNRYLDQIIQTNCGWDRDIPGIGTGAWYGLFNIFSLHLSRTLDVNTRAEWFRDVDGTRTGYDANYGGATIGLDYHPFDWLRIRPEARGDFSDINVFQNGRDRSQMTFSLDWLLQF